MSASRSSGAHCPQCGLELPPDAPSALCPRCALGAALGTSDTERDPRVLSLVGIPQPGQTVSYIGDYELIEIIAQGGMGVVYRARQGSLNRIVALKMMLGGVHASSEFKRRFRHEAETAAKLQHPNIVPIYEVGEHEGQPYFSMEYVDGETLAQKVRDRVLPAKEAANYVKTVAEAVHYAHQQGILHRDLKPSNILLGADDRPRVTDFGLAQQVDADSGLTLSGQPLGTPGYLPPEQVAAKRGTMGPWSDVYSLGALLYHLLTGRPPFLAGTLADTLDQVKNVEPVPPRSVNPAVPKDLETICLKCLEKEPKRRYASATALRDDLDHFLHGRPVLARPVSLAERAVRLAKRHPFGTALALALALALVGWIVSVRVQLGRLKQAHIELNERDVLHSSEMVQVDLAEGETVRGLSRLARAVRDHPEAQVLSQRLAALLSQRSWLMPELQLGRETRGADAVCFHPNGKRIAVAWRTAQGVSVRMFQLPSGEPIGESWRLEAKSLTGFGFSSAGDVLRVTSTEGKIFSLPISGVAPTPDPEKSLPEGFVSADGGSRLTVASTPRGFTTSLVATTNPLTVIQTLVGEEPLPSGAWSPVGTPPRFVTAFRGSVRVRNGLTGTLMAEAPEVGGIVQEAAWSPDGKVLALCTYGVPVFLWRLVDPSPTIEAYPVRGLVRSLQWSSDGSRLVATTDGGGTLLMQPGNHGPAIDLEGWTRATFAKRTTELFVGRPGGYLARVPVSGDSPVSLPAQVSGAPDRLDVTGDDRWLAVATTDQFLSIIDRATGQLRAGPVPIDPPGSKSSRIARVLGLAFSPDGHSIAVASEQHVAGLWTVPDLQPRFTWHTNSPFTSVAFSPNGHWLALASMSRCAWLVNTETGGVERFLPHAQEVLHVGFSADGKRLISTDADGQIRIWRIPDGRLELDVKTGSFQSQWAGFAPNTESLAAITFDGRVTWWSTRNGQSLADPILTAYRPLPFALADPNSALLKEQLTRAAFQPYGTQLAVGGRDWFWLIESPVADGKVPNWAMDLAEALAGVRVLRDGSVQNLSPEYLLEQRRRLRLETQSASVWSRIAQRFALP